MCNREQALAPMVEALTSFAAARCGYRSKSQGQGAAAGGREPVPLEAAIYLAGALKNVSQVGGGETRGLRCGGHCYPALSSEKVGLLNPLKKHMFCRKHEYRNITNNNRITATSAP